MGKKNDWGDLIETIAFWAADFLLRGRCCRDWPIIPLERVGKCGLCGEVPEIVGVWDD
jgi:hypothetical protein